MEGEIFIRIIRDKNDQTEQRCTVNSSGSILAAKRQGEEFVRFFNLSAGDYPSFTPVIKKWIPSVFRTLGDSDGLSLETYRDIALISDETSAIPALYIYSIEAGKMMEGIAGFSANPASMVFSEDGEYFLVGGNEKTVTEWRTGTLEYTQRGIKLRQTNYRIVYYSYDSHIAIISFSLGGYGIFDLSFKHKDKYFRRSEAVPEEFITVYNKGTKLLSKSGTIFCIFDIPSCELEAAYRYHSDIISGCFADPDRNLMFSAQWMGSTEVAVWDFKENKVVSTLCGHTSEVRAISMNHDRTLIITGEKKGIIRLWNAKTLECLETLDLQREILSFTPVLENGRFYAITIASKGILIEL